jgi:uncharacterized protein YcfJ
MDMSTLSKRGLTTGTALATALCGLMLAPAAWAGNDRGYSRGHGWNYAKVVRAEPVYRDVRVREPRQVCHEEPVTERTVYGGRPNPGAVLFGAMVGGVIGHQFGGGRGQDVATAAGAVIGANHAANHSYRNGRVVERTVYETRCETVRHARHERRIDGYDVTYKYRGRLYHTFSETHPGSRIRVRVDVAAHHGLN